VVNSAQRIGLFGGSFDPVHCGHLLVAQSACEELGLSRLFFIPAAQSPFKPQSAPAPASERLRLLRLALAAHSHYEIDPQELHRGGTSFTIDTVQNYHQRFPQAELFYLIGADHVTTLPAWRDAEKLAGLVQFVVIPRPGEQAAPLPAPFSGRKLAGFPLGVSSSQIRARIKQGLSVQGLVPDVVVEALRNSKLYL
jgi:nicotinate-nucleotide adenylyltransferase